MGAILWIAPTALAANGTDLSTEARKSEIVFIGEQHDNPVHHENQANWVADLQPTAIIFEMLTSTQAAGATPDVRDDPAVLEAALSWSEGGWPAFSMYYPIFSAAPEAEIVGAAVPRAQVGALMESELSDVLGPDVIARFGLDQALPSKEQSEREALQREAHCNALPDTFLPRMVSVQRLRDAALAKAALDALSTYGAPVVVITGNGHAREDWGAPALVRYAQPDTSVFTIGQGEEGHVPEGGFSLVVDGPTVDRGNPCDAFK